MSFSANSRRLILKTTIPMQPQVSQSSILLHVGVDASSLPGALGASCECLSAPTRDEALEMAAAIQPDVVLIGPGLLLTEALHLCGELREEDETAFVPIVLLQPAQTAEQRLEALEAGVSHIVSSSPFADELELRLRHVLEQQRSRRSLESALRQKRREEALRSEWVAYTIQELDDCLGDLETEAARPSASDGLARARRLTGALSSCTSLSQETPLARLANCELQGIRDEIEHTLGLSFAGPSLEEEAHADRELLRRALVHLTRVALRCSQRPAEETILSMSAHSSSEGPVRLELCSEAPSVWHHAFDRLQRDELLQNGLEFRSREELYLSFCKHALDAMGGDIGVEASADGGLSFWIEVPQPSTSLPPNVLSFVPAREALTLEQAASR